MPLDPQVRALLDQAIAAGAKQAFQLSVEEGRQALEARATLIGGPPQPVARVQTLSLAGPGGPLAARAYWPSTEAPLPVLVYFHGGGWVRGSLDSHDVTCRALANGAGCLVLAVDYRRAPEHRYPAAIDDAYAATVWAAEQAEALGGDRRRLAVGGDSAGGNLAAAVALRARDQGGPSLALQLLIYPITDYNLDTPSYHDNAEGYLLWRADMAWYWQQYLPNEAAGAEPYASPLRAASLAGLPPALVLTAEFDPLRDEGEAYAAALQAAGVPVRCTRYPGLVHGFFGMGGAVDAARQAVAEASQALRQAFAASPVG